MSVGSRGSGDDLEHAMSSFRYIVDQRLRCNTYYKSPVQDIAEHASGTLDDTKSHLYTFPAHGYCRVRVDLYAAAGGSALRFFDMREISSAQSRAGLEDLLWW